MTLSTAHLTELKNAGYTHIASIIKQVFSTNYYHPVTIDVLIANGGVWVPCTKGHGKYKRGIGYTSTQLFNMGYKVFAKKLVKTAKKFNYLSVLQGDYGQGFEDLTAEDKATAGWQKRIKTEQKNYQQNDAYVKSLRIISRREIAN